MKLRNKKIGRKLRKIEVTDAYPFHLKALWDKYRGRLGEVLKK